MCECWLGPECADGHELFTALRNIYSFYFIPQASIAELSVRIIFDMVVEAGRQGRKGCTRHRDRKACPNIVKSAICKIVNGITHEKADAIRTVLHKRLAERIGK